MLGRKTEQPTVPGSEKNRADARATLIVFTQAPKLEHITMRAEDAEIFTVSHRIRQGHRSDVRIKNVFQGPKGAVSATNRAIPKRSPELTKGKT